MLSTLKTPILLAAMAIPASASALPGEPRPVDMTPEAVMAFLRDLPSDDVIANGMQRAMSECECSKAEALTGYMDGLFDYYGYDYSGTLQGYAQAYLDFGEPGGMTRELDTFLQRSGFASLMMPPMQLVKADGAQPLVSRGVLTDQAVETVQAMLAQG